MIKLKLKYKGSRKYLHGSDIFNALSNNFSEIFPDSFVSNLIFKRFARNQLCILFDKFADENNLMGYGNIKLGNGKTKKFWIKETDNEVKSSYEFKEELIESQTIINRNQISVSNIDIFTLIENIIILTKKINYLLCPLIEGNWIFSQLKLETKFPKNWDKIDIILEDIKNKSYSQNKIIIDNKNYGIIKFMVAKV